MTEQANCTIRKCWSVTRQPCGWSLWVATSSSQVRSSRENCAGCLPQHSLIRRAKCKEVRRGVERRIEGWKDLQTAKTQLFEDSLTLGLCQLMPGRIFSLPNRVPGCQISLMRGPPDMYPNETWHWSGVPWLAGCWLPYHPRGPAWPHPWRHSQGLLLVLWCAELDRTVSDVLDRHLPPRPGHGLNCEITKAPTISNIWVPLMFAYLDILCWSCFPSSGLVLPCFERVQLVGADTLCSDNWACAMTTSPNHFGIIGLSKL